MSVCVCFFFFLLPSSLSLLLSSYFSSILPLFSCLRLSSHISFLIIYSLLPFSSYYTFSIFPTSITTSFHTSLNHQTPFIPLFKSFPTLKTSLPSQVSPENTPPPSFNPSITPFLHIFSPLTLPSLFLNLTFLAFHTHTSSFLRFSTYPQGASLQHHQAVIGGARGEEQEGVSSVCLEAKVDLC